MSLRVTEPGLTEATGPDDEAGGGQGGEAQLPGAGTDPGCGVDVTRTGHTRVDDEVMDHPVVAAEDAPGRVDVGDLDPLQRDGGDVVGLEVVKA